MTRARLARAALAGTLLLGPTACRKQPPPFSCARLQARAEICAAETLAQTLRALRARAATAAADDSAAQFKMFERRFRQQLRERRTQRQCERFARAPSAENSRRLARIKTCLAAQGCPAFARCLLGP